MLEYGIVGALVVAAFAIFKKEIGVKETLTFAALTAVAVASLHLCGLGALHFHFSYWYGYAAGVLVLTLLLRILFTMEEPSKPRITDGVEMDRLPSVGGGESALKHGPISKRIIAHLGLLFFVVLFTLPFVLSLR